MKKMLQIAWLHLRLTYQSRTTLVFAVLMPLVFTFVIGSALGAAYGSDDEEGPQTWRLDVSNQDAGELGQALIDTLDARPILEVALVDGATASAELDAGDAVASLLIPSDFSQRLQAGESQNLAFAQNIDDALAGQVVAQTVQAALSELGSSIQISEVSLDVADQLGLFDLNAAGIPSRGEYQHDALQAAQQRWQAGPPITVEQSVETQREQTASPYDNIPTGMTQTSPGIAVMFAMFFVVGGTASIVLEREEGTLGRLMTTPTSRAAILGGKLLGIYIGAIIQFSILVLFGQFAFGVDWGSDPAALIVMILAFTFAVTGLAMLIAALARTYAQIDAVSMALIIPLSGLGGAMWPLEIVPAWMQQVALFIPTGWAMRGFQDIVSRGLGLQDVLLEAGMLVLFGVGFLAIGVWRFRYE